MQTVQILRSQRKTLSIEVRLDGSVLVRAPLRASQARIDAVLRERQAWIESKLIQVARLRELNPVRAYQPGETFPYLGEWYPLEFVQRKTPLLDLNGSFRLAHGAAADPRPVFIRWYQQQAKTIFAERVGYWSARTGLKPTRLGLSSARTRWGSCSSKGSVNLSWRLVMAPLAALDYVIVHELVHLNIHNHSKAFWSAVAGIYPDYKNQRAWLKQNGPRISGLFIEASPP